MSTSTACTGTGPQGRITEEDVRERPLPAVPGPRDAASRSEACGASSPSTWRARIGEVPPVTWVEECDFEAVELERLVAIVVKACADELQAFPELNARLDARRDRLPRPLRHRRRGADAPRGSMVPVVRGCDEKTADEIHEELAGLAERGRAGDAGARGAPRLDVHCDERRQARRPALDADRQPSRGGDPLHRPHRRATRCARRRGRRAAHGTICVTFDHRVIDGARAAEFGLAVIERIELSAADR